MTHTTRPNGNKSKGHHTEAVPKIRTPHENDILCGRGGFVNNHPGNQIFREWVHERKNRYNLAVRKLEKTRISREIIKLVRSQEPPGRFLREDPDEKGKIWWVEIDNVKAVTKTSQALREGAPRIRTMLGVRHGSRGSLRNASRKEPSAAASLPLPVAPVLQNGLSAAHRPPSYASMPPPVAPVLPNGFSAAHCPPGYVAAAIKQYRAQMESTFGHNAMAPHQSGSAFVGPVYNMMNANKLGRNVEEAVQRPMQSNGDFCVSSFPLPYYSKPMYWPSRWER
jgi:hypothetical protein